MTGAKAEQITGLVLAGGRGQRVGGADKGWVSYRGRPLVEIVVERFAPQVGPLLISANRNLERYAAFGEVVTDAETGQPPDAFSGPLTGVLAALRRTRTDWLAMVPCDAPDLPRDLVSRLMKAAGAGAAACARVDGRLQPVFALVRTTSLPSLEVHFAAGGRAMHAWLESLAVIAVDFEDAGAFRNINSAEDAGGRAA
jgi:molybdenum cofactor guanylyltransferase